MANKLSLANKYRPHGFDDVVEQESIKTILLNQMQTNNLKHAYLFCGGAGTGKAQPLDSLVLTTTGYVRMGDVFVGQEIIDGLGEKTIITDIFPQGVKSIYKVTFSDRTSVLCSDEHLWKVGKYNKNKKQVEWSVKSVNDIISSGIEKKYRIPLPIIQFNNKSELLLDPYLVGVLLGDGAISSSSSLAFANDEIDIVTKTDKLLRDIGCELVNSSKNRQYEYRIRSIQDKYNLKSKYDYYYDGIYIGGIKQLNEYLTRLGYKTHDYRIYNKAIDGDIKLLHKFPELNHLSKRLNSWFLNTPYTKLCNILDKLDMRKKTTDKHIPKEYLYGSVETRVSVLQGLFDTDGYVSRGEARGCLIFNTSSKQLSDDFAFLVRSLGGTDTVVTKRAGYKKDNIYIKCNDTYEHTIKLPDNILPFSSEKHTKKYVKPQNGPIRKIVNIEYVGNQECQCIRVASADHTYITDNVTVTHNTTSARIIANMMNAGQGKPIELDCASNNRG